MKEKLKINTRIWKFIRDRDSFDLADFKNAMGLKEIEALAILQQLHDEGYITMKWIKEKGQLCFVKMKPFNDHVN